VRFGVFGLALAVAGACAHPPRTASVARSEPHGDEAPVSPHASPTAALAAGDPAEEDDEDAPDDGAEEPDGAMPLVGEERPHPLDGWSEEQIRDAVKNDIKKLGPMSLGNPSAGLLVNGVQASKNELFDPVSPGAAWATEETLSYLERALRRVHEEIADTPPLPLGDISAEKGGPISPHISHQTGRDVDIAYFYKKDARWYRRGNAQNLDVPRNWAFVRALVIETDVELILIDHSIQALLREHALSIGEDPVWVDGIFRGGGGLRPLIRHARGHATHIHVRFFNPLAQETARRAYAALVDRGVVPPVQNFIQHRARRGDTLGKLSKKYGVSVVAIKQANRLKKSLIREKRTYLIPVANPRPAPPARRLTFPPRRVPPERRVNSLSTTAER
jgi:penicillin-insensitive murein endopeptidase